MKVMAVGVSMLAMLAASGCGTFRMTPTQGINGPDGAMVTCSWGQNPRQALCASNPDQIPVEAYEASPERRTWVGRAMVKVGNGISSGVKATADWTAEHPFIAGSIVALGVGIGIGQKQDWWGLFDDDEDKDSTPPPATQDTELSVRQTGNNNTGAVVYRTDGNGARPNVVLEQNGNGNNLQVVVEPPEE